MRPKQNVSAKHKRIAVGREPKTQSLLRTEVLNACQLALTDGMRRPVSGQDAIRSPKLSTRSISRKQIKETGNEEE